MLHNFGTWYYFDQITELTLPDVDLCRFSGWDPDADRMVCQRHPATTYQDISKTLAFVLYCEPGDLFPATMSCPLPTADETDGWILNAYDNDSSGGWHVASYTELKGFVPGDLFLTESNRVIANPNDLSLMEPGPSPGSTFYLPALTLHAGDEWPIGAGCDKRGNRLYDGVTSGGSPISVPQCMPAELDALDEAGLMEPGGLPYPLGAMPASLARYKWHSDEEAWWRHNVGLEMPEALEENEGASFEAYVALVGGYVRGGKLTFPRDYLEDDEYFQPNGAYSVYVNTDHLKHFKTLPHPAVPGGLLSPPALSTFRVSYLRGVWDGLVDEGAPYSRAGGGIDGTLPVLTVLGSDQAIPEENCGDGVRGMSLAFLDPASGRIAHEVCATGGGSPPDTRNGAFETLGWFAAAANEEPRYTVALYGGDAPDGTLSDKLWMGRLIQDREGAYTRLEWEQAAREPNAFWPPALDGARMVQGYDGEGIYLFGGSTTRGPSSKVYRYSPADGGWKVVETQGEVDGLAVSNPSAVRKTNAVYLYGGVDADGAVSNSVRRFFPSTGYVETLCQGPPVFDGRAGATLMIAEDGAALYLFGGEDARGMHEDMWRLSLASPAGGWSKVVDDCRGPRCPDPAGAVFVDGVSGAPIVLSASDGDGSTLSRSWKLGSSGWSSSRELAGRDTAEDCDADGIMEEGWGSVCGDGGWWSEPGVLRCDYEEGGLYCDRRETALGGLPRAYWRGGVEDFDVLRENVVVARGLNVEIVSPGGWLGPVRLDHVGFGERVRSVEVDGTFIYAAVGHGISVIDASTPQSLEVVEVVPTQETVKDMALFAGRLFSVDGRGLSVFSLADPRRPALVGEVPLFDGCANPLEDWCEDLFDEGVSADSWEEELCATFPRRRVDAYGGVVAASADDEVVLLDVSNPEQAQASVVVDAGIPIREMRLHGRYLYVSNALGESAVDLADPLDPVLVFDDLDAPVETWLNGRARIGDLVVHRWAGHLWFTPAA